MFRLDPDLVEWALDVVGSAGLRADSAQAESPAVLAGPFVTSSTVTGTDEEARLMASAGARVAESMEGAAAAHVCALFGVPFLELRGISNVVGDRDRSRLACRPGRRVRRRGPRGAGAGGGPGSKTAARSV